MFTESIPRRDLIKSILAALPLGLSWEAMPVAAQDAPSGEFDAIVIGAGLGGLSCAAAFARQGFKPLVIEKHDKPGGYATAFRRPGGFLFDVSLHATGADERNGIRNLIPGFPEIESVEFTPLPYLYRAIFPEHDIRVPQKDLAGYLDTLYSKFQDEKDGIKALFDDMNGVASDIRKLIIAQGKVDFSRFPTEFPHLFQSGTRTWGQMVDARIHDPKLKAIVSALWGYFGLPPSKLASFYYAMPIAGMMTGGAYYPKGRSQNISDALAKFIQHRGGKVLLNTSVERILVKDHAAYGVMASDEREYKAKVVVSNANAYDTFHKLMEPDDSLSEYLAKMDRFSASLSTFQVFLGLKKDIVKAAKLPDAETFFETGYDPERSYKAAVEADLTNPGFGLMAYDNVFKGYSPQGKNTLSLITLQGYDHWKPFEKDYDNGDKAAYIAEKERMAAILIKQAERTLLPGLSKAIEVKEVATPLTNRRYTGNYRGAIYGWDQTLDNSGMRRLPQTTPIRNLYLAGAWTNPGGGYPAVMMSGLQCFGEVMKNWKA